MSEPYPRPPGERRSEPPQNIATAIAQVSERATLLIHEEIELAKAEVTEKATKLVKGAAAAPAGPSSMPPMSPPSPVSSPAS